MNCTYCEEPIQPEEHKPLEARLQRNMHNECLVRAVVGSAAHQLGECSCFGGTREDPPGMTARQAALLAYDTFKILRGDPFDPARQAAARVEDSRESREGA
jgi:hypothetical protein